MRKLDKKACPEVHLLEAYILNLIPSISERKRISHHIDSCPRCKALATELNLYYSILEQENKKPVSSSIFKLIDEIEKENVLIAGILLQPNDVQEKKPSMQYQSDIVLITQNDGSFDIDDLDCIPMDDNEIFIRAIQSQQTSETTLFLYANEEKLYRNVQLQIESGAETFLSDHIGKIELGKFDLNNLDDQHVIITPNNS
jgi:hypothetical protein